MIPFIITALLTMVFLLFLGYQFGRSQFGPIQKASARQLTPVDLDAFENLTDPEEEQYLRDNLPAPLFRDVQRSRIRAARMYVLALSENAGTLLAAGQSARFHSDPQIKASGTEVVLRATRLKMWCWLSLVRLNAAIVVPTLLSPSSRIANQYLMVTGMAASLPRKMSA